MGKFKPYAISLLGGTVYSTAWPTGITDGWMVTAVPGMALFLYALLGETRFWAKLRLVLTFCLPYVLIGFYWIPATLEEFGELPYPVAFILGALFTLICAPQHYISIIAIHFGLQRENISKLYQKYPRLFGLIIAAALSFIEYFTPQQFPVMFGQPWARVGEYLGFANIGGLAIYSFFSFLAAMEIVNWLRFGVISKINISAIALFIIANPLVKINNPETDKRQLNVRLVQANISSFMKVDSESGGYASVSEVIRRYKELSLEPTELEKLDLVVWPETAYPFGVETSKNDLSSSAIPDLFTEIALKQDSDVFIGGYDVLPNATDYYYQGEYNTNFHISPDGKLKDVYHKWILIPFGETLPFGPLNRYLAKHIENISFFSEGTQFPLFETRTGHTFINTICYEILKPEFVRDYINSVKQRPHALVNLTNDSWYGDTAEPEQHKFLASWRALEFDLPIIRSTNTGISTVIDRNGKEIQRLGVGETGNLDVSLNIGRAKPTVFQRFGFWALLPFWFALFIFHALLIRLKR